MREKPVDYESLLIFYGKAQHKINDVVSYLKYKEKVLKIPINQYNELLQNISNHFNLNYNFEKIRVLVSLINNEKDFGKIIKVFDNDYMVIGTYNIDETFKSIEKYNPEIVLVDTEILNKDNQKKLEELKNNIANHNLIGLINKDIDKNQFNFFDKFLIKPLQENDLKNLKSFIDHE